MVAPARGHARAREPVVEPHAPSPHTPAHPQRVELRLAHALDAAREHELRGACLNEHARDGDRLQTGAAAPVELEARNVDRETCVERRDASDRGRLAVRVALA